MGALGEWCATPLAAPRCLDAAWRRAAQSAHPAAVEAAGILLVQLVCFWLPAAADTLASTLAPRWVEARRIQKHKAPRAAERWQCLQVVLRNQALSEVMHLVVLVLSGWKPSTRVDPVLPTLPVFLLEVALCWVGRDVLFYFAHRALHSPRLYARIHKVHHKFTAPFALAAQYAHPIEHAVANVAPVMAPATAFRVHCVSLWATLALALLETTATHSGLPLLKAGSTHHDWHHEAFSRNFGAVWIDRLMGTCEPGRAGGASPSRSSGGASSGGSGSPARRGGGGGGEDDGAVTAAVRAGVAARTRSSARSKRSD